MIKSVKNPAINKNGILYKKCSGECALEKELSKENFYWRNNRKIWEAKCKICLNKRQKQYYKNNKNNVLEYQKEYYQENKEEIVEYKKDWYQENKEEILESRKDYQQENKKEINEYYRLRRKNDLIFKLHQDMSAAINKNLRQNNLTKNNKSINELLPYNMEELKEHLENHPEVKDWMRDKSEKLDWSKRGVYNVKTWDPDDSSTWKWQIDHETPKSKFKIKKEGDKQFQICWGLKNLRPFSAKQNIIDGNRR